MAAPNLSTRLALETSDRIADGLGGYETRWRQLGCLWAQMEARSAQGRVRR